MAAGQLEGLRLKLSGLFSLDWCQVVGFWQGRIEAQEPTVGQMGSSRVTACGLVSWERNGWADVYRSH